MNEHVENPMADEAGPRGAVSPMEETGNEAVDAVLRSLDALERRPVEEHVAVFESAHDRLRAALAGAGGADGRSDDNPGQR